MNDTPKPVGCSTQSEGTTWAETLLRTKRMERITDESIKALKLKKIKIRDEEHLTDGKGNYYLISENNAYVAVEAGNRQEAETLSMEDVDLIDKGTYSDEEIQKFVFEAIQYDLEQNSNGER